jgi:DNA invertase Pin-like site-specific DNA recombinase
MASPHIIERPQLPIDGVVRAARVPAASRFASLESQKKAVLEVIADHGLEAGQIFVQRPSGEPALEPSALERALERVRNGESGGVAAASLLSFGRQTSELVMGIAEIAGLGGTLITADGLIDTGSPQGRVFLGFVAALAEVEHELIAEEEEAGAVG